MIVAQPGVEPMSSSSKVGCRMVTVMPHELYSGFVKLIVSYIVTSLLCNIAYYISSFSSAFLEHIFYMPDA